VASRAILHRPGEPPVEVPLAAGATSEVLPSVRVSAADAPGVVIEGSPRRIRVAGRRLLPGERWLLRPGQWATVEDARIVAGWDDPGTAAEARSVLLAALRGEDAEAWPELHALAGPLAGRRLRLRPGVMGRGASASTRLDDPTVSREHARVRVEAGRILVEDLGSRNGSWLGGARLCGPREMAPGQEFRAGRTVLALGIVPPPGGEDAPAPSPRHVRPFPGWPSRVALLAAATAAAAALLAL
jgi:hypothetical protein